MTDASFLNGAGAANSEELKAAEPSPFDVETGRSGSNAQILPMEIEDGGKKVGDKTDGGGKVLEEDGGVVVRKEKGICARCVCVYALYV